MPTATICSTAFESLGSAESRALGVPDLPLTVVPHPIGSLAPERAGSLGIAALPGVLESILLGAPASDMVRRGTSRPPAAAASATYVDGPTEAIAATAFFFARGWGDGLPIVPPTRARVREAVAALGRDPDEEIGTVPPRWGVATVELVAANAVMAGCSAGLMRVVLAATEGVLRPSYNLYSIQATTGSVAPLVVVSGPIADDLGISGGAGCLGPGHPANLAIGRALRLVLTDIGGARPGGLDRATAGQPGKIALCVAENRADDPWPPLHVDLGHPADESIVLVESVMGTTDIIDHTSNDAEDLLHMLAGSLGGPSSNHTLTGGHSVLLLCPEHAQLLASAGLSRADVARELTTRARIPIDQLTRTAIELVVSVRRPHLFGDGVTSIPVFDAPDRLRVVVAGGPGPHSTFLPSFGGLTQPQVVPVR